MYIKTFICKGSRPNQQDAYFCSIEHSAFAVCDGVGGEVGGALASQSVCDFFKKTFCNRENNTADLQEILIHADEYIEKQNANGDLIGSTTCVSVKKDFVSGLWNICSIGDSRAYIYSILNQTFWRTRDHSLVQELIDNKLITDGPEAKTHPYKNIITKALGNNVTPLVKSDISLDTKSIKPDEVLFLCTDGVWEIIDETWFLKKISNTDFDSFNNELSTILSNNAKDNATYIFIADTYKNLQ